MSTTKYRLLDFATGCEGHWQNALYIPCGQCSRLCKLDRRGCLMTVSPGGEPVLIGVKRYEQLTGQEINPKECCGTISRETFETVYSRYLLWELDSANQCPLRQLDKRVQTD